MATASWILFSLGMLVLGIWIGWRAPLWLAGWKQ